MIVPPGAAGRARVGADLGLSLGLASAGDKQVSERLALLEQRSDRCFSGSASRHPQDEALIDPPAKIVQ